jgi:hypothetical protein
MEGMSFGMLMNAMLEPIGEALLITVPPSRAAWTDRLPADTPELAVPAEASPEIAPVDRRRQAF